MRPPRGRGRAARAGCDNRQTAPLEFHLISDSDIRAELHACDATEPTPALVRNLVLMSVAKGLSQHYGTKANTKCLQSSLAIQHLLARHGIESHVWIGELCLPQRVQPDGFVAWGGYWGDDHHVWTYTAKRSEIVDLTVKYLHQRGSLSGQASPAIPAIWCPIDRLPGRILYIPQDVVQGVDPSFEDDVRAFVSLCVSIETSLRSRMRRSQVRAEPVITDCDDLNALLKSRHHWSGVYAFFELTKQPFPPDVQRRMADAERRAMRRSSGMSGTEG